MNIFSKIVQKIESEKYFFISIIIPTINIQTFNMSAKQTSQTKLSREAIRAQNCDPEHGVSLCIPRVFANITYRQIFKVFCDARLGFVERVDVIRTKGVKRAYIHFKAGGWNMRDRTARQTLQVLQEGDCLELTYEEGKPWFWKVVVSESERPTEAPKLKPRPQMKRAGRKKTLDLGDDPITARAAEHIKGISVKDEVMEELAGLKKETPPQDTNNQFESLSDL